MAWIDPRTLSDEQLRAEIASLESKVIEFNHYHRRRWELLQELGARQQQAKLKAELAEAKARG